MCNMFCVHRNMANLLLRRAVLDAIRVPVCARASSSLGEVAKVRKLLGKIAGTM